MSRSTSRATLAILAFSVIWGAAYLWMKAATEAADRHLGEDAAMFGVALYLALRFGLGAAALLIVPSSRRELRRGSTWLGGFWLGGLLTLAFMLQLVGLRSIDPAISAFLTSLYVVFTAVVVRCHRRVSVEPRLLGGIVLASIGAAWIGGPPHLNFDLPEWLTIGGALVFAVHIVATDVITRRVPSLPVTVSSLAWVAAFSSVVAIVTTDGDTEAIGALLADGEFIIATVLSAVLATSVAIALMNRWQKELSPVRAAILYALEPVWAALFAVSFDRSEATRWLWIGGACLVAGNLVAELWPRSRSTSPVR